MKSARVESQDLSQFSNESCIVCKSHIKCSFICQEQVDMIKKIEMCVCTCFCVCVSMCGCVSLSVQCVKCSPYSHVAKGAGGGGGVEGGSDGGCIKCTPEVAIAT